MATPVNISMTSTLQIVVSFEAGTIVFVPAPRLVGQPSLLIPPVLPVTSPLGEPQVAEPPLRIPLRFGVLSVSPGDPSDPPPPPPPEEPPPPEGPPPGGGDPAGVPANRPVLAEDGTYAGVVRVRGMRVIGGKAVT